MALGISTACFYPVPTEEALLEVAKTGAKVTEVFFNSPSELEQSFLKELFKIKEENGIRVKSLHPFSSFAEGYKLFSHYERRFRDYREFYKRYYEAAAYLGADVVVLHGAKLPFEFTDMYIQRFGIMVEDAEQFGVKLAQENVVHYYGQNPEMMDAIRGALGEKFHMVFDIKQSVRAGCSLYDFIDEFAKNICHIHISDYRSDHDCIPPGEGEFDFKKFFETMREKGYNGDYTIELYRSGFKDIDQLIKSFDSIKDFA
ncbi:MAG: sugar phosphate isomerase/epimerase [Clostridia bacterium]|nr:sugar phosphate isomerase/epimerase [Clostridia bacterium]